MSSLRERESCFEKQRGRVRTPLFFRLLRLAGYFGSAGLVAGGSGLPIVGVCIGLDLRAVPSQVHKFVGEDVFHGDVGGDDASFQHGVHVQLPLVLPGDTDILQQLLLLFAALGAEHLIVAAFLPRQRAVSQVTSMLGH